MKVLLVNKFHYRRGGSETYYFALAEALKSRGHQVVFFAMQDKDNNLMCDQERYFVSNASVGGGIKSKLNMLLHIAYSKEAYQNMKRLMADEKPDLVILNLVHKQITLSIIDAIKETAPEVPVFWTMHDLIAVCPSYTMLDGAGRICEKCLEGSFLPCVHNRCIKGSMLMSWLSWYEAEYIRRKKWYDRVDLFICPSEFYRHKLVGAHFTASPIITMRNPLPLDTRYELCDTDEGYVLYFGRLAAEKGVKTLIDAAKRIGCRLIIVGTGPMEAELKAHAAGIDNIEFKGFQTGDALKDYIRNSRCVVLPSEWYENGPYSAMEAMAMGKPLVVSAKGGLPELVDDGQNGYICDQSEHALAECLSKMLALSQSEYRNMACCALEKARAMFDADRYVAALEEQVRLIKKADRTSKEK